jgi:hypothetical protein
MQTLPTIEKAIAAGTAKLIADPSRIARAIYADHMLPPTGKLLTEMLADCSRLLRAQVAHGNASRGHLYDINRHIALQQAEGALLALIVGEPVAQQKAAA